MDIVNERDMLRSRFLRSLCQRANGSTVVDVPAGELQHGLALNDRDAALMVDDLVSAQWATRHPFGKVRITHDGLQEVARMLEAESATASGTIPMSREQEWRKKFDAMPIEELQDGLATQRFGQDRSPKASIARLVLEAKQAKHRESSEVAALKADIADLRRQLNDKRTTLFWTRVGVILAAIAGLAAWRQDIAKLVDIAMAALKR
jgi:hypothetical protein